MSGLYQMSNLNVSTQYSQEHMITLYFKVSLLQCKYRFKYWVILINYMYLLYGKG